MNLEGLRIACLTATSFEDLEFWVPVMRLREELAQVVIAGPYAGEVLIGKIGIPATTDISFDDLRANDFDAAIIPGGWAPDQVRRFEPVKRFLFELNDQGKTIGMICHAGLVGISAGIVAGHQATGSLGIKDDLINAGAEWRDEPAFRSGHLVWGRIVADIPDYCRELVQALKEQLANR